MEATAFQTTTNHDNCPNALADTPPVRLIDLSEVDAFFKRLWDGKATAEELRETYHRYCASDEVIVAGLNKRTIAQLGQYLGWDRRGKKAGLVRAAHRNIRQEFACGETVVFSLTKARAFEEAVDAAVARVTDDLIQSRAQARKEKIEATRKAITDPQTYDEFLLFLRYRTVDTFNHGQFIRYSALSARHTRERRAYSPPTTVKAFQNDIEMELEKGWHSKENKDVWVVKLTGERLESAAFHELKEKAAQLGGWWSSFIKSRKGFHFWTEETANMFMGLKEGDQDRTEILAEREQRKAEYRHRRTLLRAENHEANADEILERDRLTNTARRVGIAERMEANARAEKRTARTLARIADAAGEGTAWALDHCIFPNDIWVLRRILNRAQYEHKRMTNDEGIWERDPNEQDLRYTKYPWPQVNVRFIHRVGQAADGVPGCTRLAQKFLRWTTNCTDEFRTLLPGEIADLIELLKHARRLRGVVSDAAWLNSALSDYKTMQRMNLCTVEEMITALVQFLACEAEPIEGDPLKAAERSLVGMQIDGFYPTPPIVIDLMLDQVEIEEGMLCLEPSAGSGKIADALRDRGGEVDCVEINYTLRQILALKGHNIIGQDIETTNFEHLAPEGYELVMMNPPFERGQDIDHVMIAYDAVMPGGMLVSVMSGATKSRQDQKTIALRELVEKLQGEWIDVPEGSFRHSDRPTGVNTVILVLTKPETEPIESGADRAGSFAA